MTVALAKAKGFAYVPPRGTLGYAAKCDQCTWEQAPSMRRYHSDASKAAREHNARVHGGAK